MFLATVALSSSGQKMVSFWSNPGQKVQQADESTPPPRVTPRGIQSGRCDDKGRLKLSVEVEKFLKGQELFVTSWDGRIGRIYPLPLWQTQEQILSDDKENPEWADDMMLTADKYGGAAEVDGQGRVMMPTTLRRKMGIENQPVKLRHFGGVILVYSESAFEEDDQRAQTDQGEKIKNFRRMGLK